MSSRPTPEHLHPIADLHRVGSLLRHRRDASASLPRSAMKRPQGGNGSPKFEVGAHDMGGWVRVIASDSSPPPDDLGFYLAHRLSHWFGENPHRRLVCVVPINRDGFTVELHGWYEQHLFADISLLAPVQPKEEG